jgi:hypothetical protein
MWNDWWRSISHTVLILNVFPCTILHFYLCTYRHFRTPMDPSGTIHRYIDRLWHAEEIARLTISFTIYLSARTSLPAASYPSPRLT